MNNTAQARHAADIEIDPCIHRMYHHMMASWVVDLLQGPRTPVWLPEEDEDNRPWRELYAGSVLDD